MDVSTEIQETLGRSYSVPDDIDEEDLMGGKLLYYRKAQIWGGIFISFDFVYYWMFLILVCDGLYLMLELPIRGNSVKSLLISVFKTSMIGIIFIHY